MQISALELELELLQNQANELHLFLGRHQHLMGLPPPAPLERLASPKPLQGKEVMPGQLAPEQSRSTRFSVVDSFPPNMRKREHGESAVNVEMHEAPHAKRQRVVVTEKQVNSLSDRLANWLMPITTTSTPGSQTDAPTQGDAPPEEAAGTTSRQFFPFKQRQPTPGPRRPRRSGRPHPGVQKTPTALQAIEQWFFTDKDGNPRTMPFGNQAPSY
ncbi:hypothetical protein BBJ28_00018384 [Nothophytophthora sp. Chile5]|nr:hypothetical protein BBJ28_00018384 [Nothophytophthora sp. Chile5]